MIQALISAVFDQTQKPEPNREISYVIEAMDEKERLDYLEETPLSGKS